MYRFVITATTSMAVLFFIFFLTVAEAVDPAESWQKHYNLWFIISIIIWLTVTVPLVYFVFRYKKKREDEDGAYIEGSTFLEITWTGIPIIITIVLGVQSWALFNQYRKVPQDAYEVRVEGFQYGYEMIYSEGIKTLNELRVPVGPVKLSMISKDVIHNFAIPKYKVREDMIPGRMTYQWFLAKEPGEHMVYCAELCGPGHSQMLAKVIVMEKNDFNSWVESYKIESSALSPEERGKNLVKNLGCTSCHSLDGEEIAGASFKGYYGGASILEDGSTVTVDDAYIEESIKNPKAKVVKGYDPFMQPYSLPDEDIKAITAYLKTLK